MRSQEFRVDSLLSPADAGATGGPNLHVISPSGTNRFHGSLFEFLRNNIFDASEPAWASAGEDQQPLRLNQFGGSLGGPIVRDKTFFFLASEAYRQNWGYPVIGGCRARRSVLPFPPVRLCIAILNAYPVQGPRTILTPWAEPRTRTLTS